MASPHLPSGEVMSGIDLLINPRKRPPSDVMSTISSASRSSGGGGGGMGVPQTAAVSRLPADVTVGAPSMLTRRPSTVILEAGVGDAQVEEPLPPRATVFKSAAAAPPWYRGATPASRSRSVSTAEDDDDDEDMSDEEDEEEEEDETEEEYVSARRRGAYAAPPQRLASPMMTADQIERAKREILYQFDRLERKGLRMPRRYTMSDSLEDMRAELERLKLDREVDASVKFQRRMLMACVTGIELFNNHFDPFALKLDGWSESLYDNLDDYDDVFEELHMKYRSRAKMAPELKLLMMVGGSGMMFHLTSAMFRSAPGLEQVVRENPELRRQLAQATLNTMQNNQPQHPVQQQAGSGGLMGMIGSLFGGGGTKTAPAPVSVPMARPPPTAAAVGGNSGSSSSVMRGPMHVDDILRELHQEAFAGDEVPTPASASAPAPSAPLPPPQATRRPVLQRAATGSDMGSELGEAALLADVVGPELAPPAPKPRKPRAPKGAAKQQQRTTLALPV